MSSTGSVELAKDWHWWVWHGFRPFSRIDQALVNTPELQFYGGKRRAVICDPMDRKNFEEEHAFPLVKPAIDIFGIPPRSRKQRGWYQVRSPSRLATQPSTSSSHLVCAANLPSELDILILAEVCSMAAATPKKPYDPQPVVACANVCRNWARILQPQLFSRVGIQSYGQLLELRSFFDAPTSNVSQYHEWSICEQSLDGIPFTHLVPSAKERARHKVRFTLQGPLPRQYGVTVRSITPCVPRSMPRRHYEVSQLARLDLKDIHFQSFVDLMRLLVELPGVVDFLGSRLTWPPQSLRRPVWRRRVSCGMLRLEDCTAGQRWPALWLADPSPPVGCPPHAVDELVRKVDQTLQNVDSFILRRGLGECSRYPLVINID